MTNVQAVRYGLRIILTAIFLSPLSLCAQDVQTKTTIADASGEVVYLDLGSNDSIEAGDTLTVLINDGVVGRLRVLRTTENRLVAVRIESDLLLSKGDEVVVRYSPHESAKETDDEEPPDPVVERESVLEQPPERTTVHSRRNRRISGRVIVGLPFYVSSSPSGTENRIFVTPSLGWRGNMSLGSPNGGLTLYHNLRLQYRYSDVSSIDPELSFRIYSLRLKKEFSSLPVSAGGGRFRPEYESYSGYWDGAFIDFGSDESGMSVLAGYQPLRGNETLSSALPKLAASGRIQTSRSGLRYRVEATVAHMLSTENGDSHTFSGLSQYLVLGRFRLVQRLRLDQGISSSEWKTSQMLFGATYRISPRARLDASYNHREPFLISERTQQFGLRRDDWRFGATIAPGRYNGRIEYALQSQENRADSWMINTNWYGVVFPSTGVLLNVNASYWTMDQNKTIAWGGSADRSFDKLQARLSLRRYQYDYALESRSTTQTDVGISYRTASKVTARINWQSQFGSGLSMNRIQLGVYIQY